MRAFYLTFVTFGPILIALNKKHASRDVLSFKNFIYEEKLWKIHTKWKRVKNIFKDKILSRKFEAEALAWTFEISSTEMLLLRLNK